MSTVISSISSKCKASCTKMNYELIKIAEIFNQYIKPDFEISEKIEEITGIRELKKFIEAHEAK